MQSGIVPRVVTFLLRDDFSKLQVRGTCNIEFFIDNRSVKCLLTCFFPVRIWLFLFSLRQLGRSPTLLQGHQRTQMSSLKVVLSQYSSNFSPQVMKMSVNRYTSNPHCHHVFVYLCCQRDSLDLSKCNHSKVSFVFVLP